MASDRCAQVLGADSADSESANHIERPPAPPGKAHSGASWHRELEVGFIKNLNCAPGRNPGVGYERNKETPERQLVPGGEQSAVTNRSAIGRGVPGQTALPTRSPPYASCGYIHGCDVRNGSSGSYDQPCIDKQTKPKKGEPQSP